MQLDIPVVEAEEGGCCTIHKTSNLAYINIYRMLLKIICLEPNPIKYVAIG